MAALPTDSRRLAKRVHELAAEVAAPGLSHLERAVRATALAEAADYLARVEVTASRSEDRTTWQEVGDADGVGRQTAHERFSQGPDGMRSRSSRYGEGWRKARLARDSASPIG